MIPRTNKVVCCLLILMLGLLLNVEAVGAENDLVLETMPGEYTVYLEGQTFITLGSTGLTESSARALNLRKAPTWSLVKVSGDSLTLQAKSTSRTLDDGTVIYGCDLILYSLSKAGDTVFELECKAGKRSVTQRFVVHCVSSVSGLPKSIAFSATVFQANMNELIAIEPAIVCNPNTTELPDEAMVHCNLDAQGIAAINQSVFSVTRYRTVLSFEVPGTYQAIFTYTLSNLKYSVPVTFRILDMNGESEVQANSLKLNPSSLWLTKGETQTIKPIFTPSNASDQGVKWSSSNSAVVSVSDTGVVKGLAYGTAIITCTPDDIRCPATSCFVTVEEWLSVEGFEEEHELYLQGDQQNTLFQLSLSTGTIRRIQEEGLHVEWLLIPQDDTGVATQMYIAPDRLSAVVETSALNRAGTYQFEVRCETEMVEWSQNFSIEVIDLEDDFPQSVTIKQTQLHLTVGQTATVDFSPVCTPESAQFPQVLRDGFSVFTGYGGFYGAIDRSVYRVSGDKVTIAFNEEGSYLLLRTWKANNLSYSVSCCFMVESAQQPDLLSGSVSEAIVYLGGESSTIDTYRIDSGLYELLGGQVVWGLQHVSGNSTTATLDINNECASFIVLAANSQGQDVWRISCLLQGISVTKQITIIALAPRQQLPQSIQLSQTEIRGIRGEKSILPLNVTCLPEGSALPDTGDNFWCFNANEDLQDTVMEANIENGCLQIAFYETGYYTGSLVYRSGNVSFNMTLYFTISEDEDTLPMPKNISLCMINTAEKIYPEGKTDLSIATVGLSLSDKQYIPGGLAAFVKEKNPQWNIVCTKGKNVTLSLLDKKDGTANLILESVSGTQDTSWRVDCTIDGKVFSVEFDLQVAQQDDERPQPQLENAAYKVDADQGILLSNKVVSSNGAALQSVTSWDPSSVMKAINYQYDSYDDGWYTKFYLSGIYKTTVDVLIGNLQFSLPMTIYVSTDQQSTSVVMLPAGVTSIEENAFAGSGIVVLDATGTKLQYIGPNAFNGCRFLTDIYLPNSVKTIDSTAFSGCGTIVIHCTDNSYAQQWAAGKSQFVISYDLQR